MQAAGIIIALVVLYFLTCIRILFEYERGVVFRLGRALENPKGPGIILIFWPIDRMVKVSLRTTVQDVPSQDIITKDNVSVKVNAFVYFRVVTPMSAVLQVQNYFFATTQLSQTTLRSVIGQAELDELLSERDKLNRQLQQIIDQQTDPWGVKVSLVEVKYVDLPEHMKRSMARQAESERERRAKVIHANGEYQAASRLRDAATTIQNHPMAMQMRYLQTLVELGTENNTTVIFPLPMEMLNAFMNKGGTGDTQTPSEPPMEPPPPPYSTGKKQGETENEDIPPDDLTNEKGSE